MSLEKNLNSVIEKTNLVEIYGLGYVGFPLAVRLGSNGINIVGIDTNSNRIERLKNNELFDSELNLEKEFKNCRNKNKIELSESPQQSSNSKIGIICVPTPIPNKNTKSDVYVVAAVETFLKNAKEGDLIILESSIEIGTTEKIEKMIESKGFIVGKNFGLCFCPERIDPANKEWGVENIPRVIYCSDDVSYEIAKKIYENVNKGNLLRVSTHKVAEMVKSFENAFRLVNISLVNELAVLCDSLGVNVKEIIDAASTKPFGFLAHYPGAGAGGHCIPKDPQFLLDSAKNKESSFESIEHALKINDFMPKYICDSIEKKLEEEKFEKVVLVCGLSYKANVEDMRDSPSFKIIQDLKKRGFEIYGFDSFFNMEFKEKYLIENHISELNFEYIKNIDDELLKKISCLCVVQHHEIDKEKISDIIKNGLVPIIYDCQNKIRKNSTNKSEIMYLGN